MRRLLSVLLAAAAAVACTGPLDPGQGLSGVWVLDTSTAGVPPREMTLVQTGTRITGTGTAMGVDVPIPVGVTGTYIAANPAGPASVTLAFAFENGGGITGAFTGTLSAANQLEGRAVYSGIISNGTITGQLTFTRPPGTAWPPVSRVR
ncbi:MAG TPA: hypothetical protein VMF70_02060 [Gemmatimonadales bacterium]|nr:hypothetical protein [Gemmatimonadales bacterium]